MRGWVPKICVKACEKGVRLIYVREGTSGICQGFQEGGYLRYLSRLNLVSVNASFLPGAVDNLFYWINRSELGLLGLRLGK